ncbi:MAG: hypothetical protein RR280_01395 [Bacteroidaceae bacterium]
MTINSGDIKIFKADTNTDDPDGGGYATNQEVMDGVDNNLFPDKSQLDTVYGRVNLRKAFMAVVTANRDTLFGSHIIFTEIPKDPKVFVCAFQSNGNFGDRRNNAQDHLETYLAEGPLLMGELMERQLQGQRAITIMTYIDTPAPTVGQSVALSSNETFANSFVEYARIISVSSVRRDFVIDQANGTTKPLLVHTCELTAALKNTHMGFTPTEYLKGLNSSFLNHTRVRETRVADAAKYYSARPLATAAVAGQAAVNVDTIYTNLVPSAQSESPLVDLNMVGRSTTMVTSGSSVSYSTNLTISTSSTVTQIGTGIARGSVRIALNNGQIIVDDGAGLLMKDGVNVGTIKYDTGVATWVINVFTYSGPATFTITPAFPNVQAQHTDFINVTEQNRGAIWAYTLNPVPARGTLQLIYQYNNKNYIVYDNGDGTMSGVAQGIGSGTINYETGTFNVTLNAYPDVGSALVMQWGNKLVSINASDTQQPRANCMFDLGLTNLTPKRAFASNPTISWSIGATAYSATVDRYTGEVTGDAEGQLLKGVQTFRPKRIAPLGTVFVVNSLLDGGLVSDSKTVTGTMNSGTITLSNVFNAIPTGVKLIAGSVNFNLSIEINSPTASYASANSQSSSTAMLGSMALFDKPTSDANIGELWCVSRPDVKSTKQGTVNYATGVVTLNPTVTFIRWKKVTKVTDGDGYYGYMFRTSIDTVETFEETITNISNVNLGGIVVNYQTVSDGNVPVDATTTLSGYALYINPVTGYNLDTNKISFRVGSYFYSLSQGNVVRSSSTSTEGLVVGTYEVVNGVIKVMITNNAWNTGGDDSLIKWLMVGVDAIEIPQNFYTFVTPLAPLRAGSFQLSVFLDGAWRQFLTNAQGEINNEYVVGKVNFLTGLVQISLIKKYTGVTPAVYTTVKAANPDIQTSGGTAVLPQLQTYHSATNTYDLRIPTWATPSSIRYTAIALTYLPLDAGILKLDPVRLPADGRVPCFRTADVIVISKDVDLTLPAPMIGQTGNLGETLLSVVKVVDSNNKQVSIAEISVNLDTGVYTVTDDFLAANYVNPIYIKAKAQDMMLVQDVQVSGVLTLGTPLIHSYPVGSLVSSAIVVGDKTSRAYNYFQQQTFNNQWKDISDGSVIPARYNFAAAPIAVTNEGAITERWAMVFTTSTTFNIVGEFVGVLGSGNTASACSPINPANNKPYFTIPATTGWGQGWASGNVLRFNTEGTTVPIWVVRTILQGQSTEDKDGFSIQLRGDVDNEN